MSDHSIITKRVTDELVEAMDIQESIELPWLAHKIIKDTGGVPGHPFQAAVLYRGVREALRKALNTLTGIFHEEKSNQQISLPGYEHLHQFYSVKRGSVETSVSINAMTDDELEAKEHLFRSQARAGYAHADEMGLFRRRRIMEAV